MGTGKGVAMITGVPAVTDAVMFRDRATHKSVQSPQILLRSRTIDSTTRIQSAD